MEIYRRVAATGRLKEFPLEPRRGGMSIGN